MKCQILFSGKNKKNITNLSSAVVKIHKIKLTEFYKIMKLRVRFCQESKSDRRIESPEY